jgi:hypothetical protein
MKFINIKLIIGLVALFSTAGLALANNQTVRSDDNMQQPDLPPVCSNLQVPPGNKVSFHVYAIGVQVYRWNGASWSFVAPVANLYADKKFKGKVGTHYAGPTWESNSGSEVIGSVLTRCTPDPTAVPWLLLEAVPTDDPGIFSKTTYIQRVNTTGGLAPAMPGMMVGEEKEIPYTTEYYFYRADD